MSTDPAPWRKLRERHAKSHHIFTVRTFDVADPRDGKEYVRTVIDAPDWVNVVAITRHDEVVLVRQFRFGVWANTLEIPGGVVDPGEPPEVAARRELEEETGYRPEAFRLLGTSHPNPAIQNNRIHAYLATGCELAHGGRPDSSEDLRVELCPRAQLRALVQAGAITHSLVLTALLYEAYAGSTP